MMACFSGDSSTASQSDAFSEAAACTAATSWDAIGQSIDSESAQRLGAKVYKPNLHQQ